MRASVGKERFFVQFLRIRSKSLENRTVETESEYVIYQSSAGILKGAKEYCLLQLALKAEKFLAAKAR